MTVDFAIVGAGPAGMAAAIAASEFGLDTVLIDEQAGPGGQIYRAIETAGAAARPGGGDDPGRALAADLRASAVRYLPATTVWHIDPDGTLSLAAGGGSETMAARRILLATGALERPMPIAGWTLPGVMTAGGAQILLKASGLIPEGRIVLAGQGPLIYLVAAQLTRAGAPPAAVLTTTPAANYRRAAADLGALWPGRRMLAEGLRLIREIGRAGVPIRHGVRRLQALGRRSLERVAWDGGEIAADHLLLHEGVIPNIQISAALQVAHEWDHAQLCWRPQLDAWGRTSLPGIAIAGDGGGILGAAAAALSGRLAALDAATGLGRLGEAERDIRARPILRALAGERAFRRFLDRLYRPARATLVPQADDIIACRCEEVSVGRIRRAVGLGATGPNQLKAFTRCGMGPCQGRICGPIVSAVIADALGQPTAAVGIYRPRAPYKPITVGALAGLDGAGERISPG